MSAFEHYDREFADLDREIAHWAAVCRIDPTDAAQLEACRQAHLTVHGLDHPHDTLRGLLLLRLKLEAEVIGLGLAPPPYRPPGGGAH